MNTCCRENWAFDEYTIEVKYLVDAENAEEIQEIFLFFFGKKVNDNIAQELLKLVR